MNKRLTMVLKMGRGLMWTLDILVRAEIHFLDTFCCFYFIFIFTAFLSCSGCRSSQRRVGEGPVALRDLIGYSVCNENEGMGCCQCSQGCCTACNKSLNHYINKEIKVDSSAHKRSPVCLTGAVWSWSPYLQSSGPSGCSRWKRLHRGLRFSINNMYDGNRKQTLRTPKSLKGAEKLKSH